MAATTLLPPSVMSTWRMVAARVPPADGPGDGLHDVGVPGVRALLHHLRSAPEGAHLKNDGCRALHDHGPSESKTPAGKTNPEQNLGQLYTNSKQNPEHTEAAEGSSYCIGIRRRFSLYVVKCRFSVSTLNFGTFAPFGSHALRPRNGIADPTVFFASVLDGVKVVSSDLGGV